MSFWDRFVLRVYLGLGGTLPAGRDAVGRLFDLALTRGDLNPAGLSDTSVLILLPPAPPAAGPAAVWFGQLDPAERAFLDRCSLFLPEPEVVALFLHLYAGLTAEQLAAVWQISDPTVTAEAVVRRLEEDWIQILV